MDSQGSNKNGKKQKLLNDWIINDDDSSSTNKLAFFLFWSQLKTNKQSKYDQTDDEMIQNW